MRLMASLRASSRSPLLQVLKTSVAAIIAWLICTVTLGQPLPIFAAIAALLVVQPSVNQSLAKGIERSVGVIFGVVLAYAAGILFGHSSWIVLGIIVVSLLVAWALRLSPGSANQIPISAMLVIAIGTNTPGYAVNRVIETVIGAIVGLAVNAIIVPPVLLTPAHGAVVRLAERVADTLSSFATALRTPQNAQELAAMLTSARQLPALRNSATDALVRADESLMLNPRRVRYREALERDRDLLDTLGILVTRVTGMARALHDNYDTGLADDRFVGSIALELDRAAHDLRLLARDTPSTEPTPITAELPALTAPLVIALPDPDNWILVGSLLEDLRRVREVIIGEVA
ncbi:aromatic acid exporter family protein [Frigoribacterium sp. UYMn621]|jgi:uncharacterized membrane protein YgaE (UPF0421/DUF939 family)|uniref:FUSC family protein n=1 Tax=Frigoribacterium sp. UYMn621 TaxID=3156343 RepID=UPI003397A2C1